jgi:hypothetical protein
MNRLTSLVTDVINQLFPQAERVIIQEIMQAECSDKLPLVKTSEQIERIQLAVLKLSNGDTDRLLKEIREARRDWRDVLMAADFGSDLNAHLNWANHTIS